MAADLSDRQKEYLDFIRQYINDTQSSPQLREIANHFHVKPTSAHKMLRGLEKKGSISFNRDSYSGFYIRCFDQIGTNSTATEVGIVGKIDRAGEVFDFPEKIGHFPIVIDDENPEDLFVLEAWYHIPTANILGRDLLIFDQNKEPLAGDIGILPVGDTWFLVRLKIDDSPQGERKFLWNTLIDMSEIKKNSINLCESIEITPNPISPDYILATFYLQKRRLTI